MGVWGSPSMLGDAGTAPSSPQHLPMPLGVGLWDSAGGSSPARRWTCVGRGRSLGWSHLSKPSVPIVPSLPPSLPGHLLPAGLRPTGLTGRLRQLHAALRQPQLGHPRAAGERPRGPGAGGGGSVLTAVTESTLRGDTAQELSPLPAPGDSVPVEQGCAGSGAGDLLLVGRHKSRLEDKSWMRSRRVLAPDRARQSCGGRGGTAGPGLSPT